MTIKMFSLSIFLVFFCSVVQAGNVEIIKTEFIKQGDTWRVGTTLQHDDAGWKHFADAWRVVDEKGKELGKRILHHPHDKKPFTRYLPSLKIPAATTIVYIEAHDKKHGWSKQRVKVDLRKTKGDRFKVIH